MRFCSELGRADGLCGAARVGQDTLHIRAVIMALVRADGEVAIGTHAVTERDVHIQPSLRRLGGAHMGGEVTHSDALTA